MDPIAMKLVADDLIMQALREDITFEDVSEGVFEITQFQSTEGEVIRL